MCQGVDLACSDLGIELCILCFHLFFIEVFLVALQIFSDHAGILRERRNYEASEVDIEALTYLLEIFLPLITVTSTHALCCGLPGKTCRRCSHPLENLILLRVGELVRHFFTTILVIFIFQVVLNLQYFLYIELDKIVELLIITDK